jgi:putative two-component system response regulator
MMENKKMTVPRILITDDVEANRFVLKDIISGMDFQPVLAENGEQALKIAERFSLELVITDVSMPVMDGYEFCRRMKENPNTRDVPIIFISAYDEPTDVVKGFAVGGADYITKPFIPEVVRARVGLQVRLAENARKLQELNRNLQVSVTEQFRQVEREKRNVLYAVSRVARENSAYDEIHTVRMGKNCRLLAEAMQLSPKFEDLISDNYIETIELAAPLCDIGTVAVPVEILQKPEPLSEEERRIIRTHTRVGNRIFGDIEEMGDDNFFIRMSKDIAGCHHENWDGSGYPEGRKGNEIPLAAQIAAVADTYGTLTENRTYRRAYEKEEAVRIMEQESGVKFNPDIFAIFHRIQRRLY